MTDRAWTELSPMDQFTSNFLNLLEFVSADGTEGQRNSK